MKLQTKNQITFNNPNKFNESITDKVIGEILSVGIINNFETFNITYVYKTSDNKIIKSGNYSLKKEQIIGLSTAIKDLVTPHQNFTETLSEQFFLGFKFLMAQTFEIESVDIELIK